MKTEHVTPETLAGSFAPLIPVMTDQVLESMVTHLVRRTCDSDCSKNNEKGVGEEEEVEDFVRIQREDTPCNEVGETKSPMTWNSILKDLLTRCPQLCTDEPLKQTTVPLCGARWRETNDRQVLAPLDLRDNIIAGNLDMSRKRKAEFSHPVWIPNKRLKVEEIVKPCCVVVKRDPLNILSFRRKNRHSEPALKLYDFFKEVPQVAQIEKEVPKEEFMGLMRLGSAESRIQPAIPPLRTGNHIKLANHPQIPFSSDYGRALLARERHCLPQEVALRKIDKIEWYLKHPAPVIRSSSILNNNNNYYKNNNNNLISESNVFNKKVRNLRTYKFPKRQYHQRHLSLTEGFSLTLCKPLRVNLLRIDVTPYLEKFLEYERLNVIVISDDEDDDVFIVSETNKPKRKCRFVNCTKIVV